MTIKVLKPKILKPERVATPQCTAVVDDVAEWRKDRYRQLRPHMNPLRCQRESVVEIEGKPYCRLHAGGVVLEMWLSGKLVERT